MGDGMTHAARDAERHRAVEKFLGVLLEVLKAEDGSKDEELEKAAKAADDIGNGYFSQRTNLCYGLKAMLERLRAQDRDEWRELLRAVDCDFPRLIKRFEKAAPRGLSW